MCESAKEFVVVIFGSVVLKVSSLFVMLLFCHILVLKRSIFV